MKKKWTLLLVAAFAVLAAAAQETTLEERVEALEKESKKIKGLTLSGYIQGQFQWGQQDAVMKVGSINENPLRPFSRFGVRRGRLKVGYQIGIASAVFQLDITEKGLGVKDAYLNIEDPWFRSMALRAGLFYRPFGYEISYSSSVRESPERSTIIQMLFPDERDLGAMFVLQAPKSSPWSLLKLEAGFFSGNGIKPEIDSKRDFIGHLSAVRAWGAFSLGAGVSYYNGKVFQDTENVYTMRDGAFVLNNDASNDRGFAKREYIGFDLQLAMKSVLGHTRLHGEYIFGRQPGAELSSKSPNGALSRGDTYLRDMQGGYVMLAHDIAKTPIGLVAKYDWYDPNTKIRKSRVGTGGSTFADLAQSTWGLGVIWRIDSALRLTAYYELNKNETSAHVEFMEKNRKDDLFTLRLQYKF